MKFERPDLSVVGGGLAGSEAAWQAAARGLHVHLYEMRPGTPTGAHLTASLAELVCSNSLGSTQLDRAQGLLKEELRLMGSFLLKCAEENTVPAGGALAVDRQAFAASVTAQIEANPNIEIIRQEVTQIPPGLVILASGPLTSQALSAAIASLTGKEHLYFFDAIAPILSVESIDMERAYKASRYNQGENLDGDYINCPMTREEYLAFAHALVNAERIALKEFEKDLESGVTAGMQNFFEGCLPVEIIAQRGIDSLAYGPLRPIGLKDPHTGKRPYAVVQLRQDNQAGSLYNMVGFQTNLTFPEQQRVFRLIPGLEHAHFERFGQMHRNTFIFSPAVLRPTLQHIQREDLFFAGQIMGIEGYAGNMVSGLLAGWNAARLLQGKLPLALPETTMTGALMQYIVHASARDFQPMKANFGLLPPIAQDKIRHLGRRERARLAAERAVQHLSEFLKGLEQ
mgnify:CR=1 FL=1